MSSRRARLILIGIQVVGFSVALAGGFYVGRESAVAPLRARVEGFREQETFGYFVDDEEKRDRFAEVYLDPETARREMDGYSWVVPCVMAPFVGHLPRPGKSATASINLYSCRTERELTVVKSRDTYRIFVLGGSTMYGSAAPSDATTIGGFLETFLNERKPEAFTKEIEVYPLANPAWTTTHERILVVNRVADLEPDLIVSFSGVNDIRWAEEKKNVLWFRSYADELFFRLQNDVLELVDENLVFNVAYPEPTPPTPALIGERLTRNVRQILHVLEPEGISYAFFLQPTIHLTGKPLTSRELEWTKEDETVSYYRNAYDEVIGQLGELTDPRLHVFDLRSLFDGVRGEVELFLDSVHFGDRGNRLIAEELALRLLPLVVGD